MNKYKCISSVIFTLKSQPLLLHIKMEVYNLLKKKKVIEYLETMYNNVYICNIY